LPTREATIGIATKVDGSGFSRGAHPGLRHDDHDPGSRCRLFFEQLFRPASVGYPRRMGAGDESLPQLATADQLARSGEPAAGPRTGSMRTELANAMVGMKKDFFGRGPTAAKAWLLDEYVFVVMEGGLTRNEEVLLEAGKEDLVRGYRLAFQEAVRETALGVVEEIVGRRVSDYHSQITFAPVRAFEIFVLAPEGDDDDVARADPGSRAGPRG
jgi:uncharacterized protein YbcI